MVVEDDYAVKLNEKERLIYEKEGHISDDEDDIIEF